MRPMQRLAPQHWIPVFERLRCVDAMSLLEAPVTHADRHALETARALWTSRAMQRAWLVTLLDGGLRVDSIPTPSGYVLRCGAFEIHASRRMYVHEFPEFCAVVAPQCQHADSFLAFPPEVARTLPIFAADRDDLTDVALWTDSRLHTAQPTREAIQAHARFFVNFRTGPPKKQRGRRARRWTKVTF